MLGPIHPDGSGLCSTNRASIEEHRAVTACAQMPTGLEHSVAVIFQADDTNSCPILITNAAPTTGSLTPSTIAVSSISCCSSLPFFPSALICLFPPSSAAAACHCKCSVFRVSVEAQQHAAAAFLQYLLHTHEAHEETKPSCSQQVDRAKRRDFGRQPTFAICIAMLVKACESEAYASLETA